MPCGKHGTRYWTPPVPGRRGGRCKECARLHRIAEAERNKDTDTGRILCVCGNPTRRRPDNRGIGGNGFSMYCSDECKRIHIAETIEEMLRYGSRGGCFRVRKSRRRERKVC